MPVFLGSHNCITPLGLTSQENYLALLSGRSGIQELAFPFSENKIFCSKINEQVVNDAFEPLEKNGSYTFLEKMALLSISDVLKQSQISLEDTDNLLILSSTKGNIDVLEHKYPSIPLERAYLHELSNITGSYFKCAHKPLIVSNACISGLLAMIIAKRLIESQRFKNIIVCGVDLVSEFTLSGFKSFNALSKEACKPFDKERTGINLGEASASILLSSNPISKLQLSSGSSANDANHISGPSREASGLFQSIGHTLNNFDKKLPDFISAHGTATEYNDEMEAVAFSRAGLESVPVNSLKAYYGHTLGAAGVLESVISLMSLENNNLISSKGYQHGGTSQPLNVIQRTEKRNLHSCLKTASGFGGCNASALFEKTA